MSDPMPSSTSDLFMEISLFLSTKYLYFEFIPACVGVILNIFHLIILTRKSMRTSSINSVMIAISICDLLGMLYLIYKTITTYFITPGECSNYLTKFSVVSFLIATAIKEVAHRSVSWLGVILASIRLLIVKSSVNPKLNKVSKQGFGVIVSIIVFLLSFLITLFYFGRIRLVDIGVPWTPAEHCKNFPVNYTEPQFSSDFSGYSIIKGETVTQIYLVSDGILKLLNSVLLPILTILLIIEVREAKKKINMAELRDPSASSKANHTTKLVALMTITFMIADGPIGVITVLQGIFIDQNLLENMSLISLLFSLLYIFMTFNASIHCIICLTVSSPYRETVKSLFFCHKDDPNLLFKTSRVSATGPSGNGRQRNDNQ